ncbi:MAG: hypothetical protein IPM35_19315 [Myxococcales bacterium]|nr:hypothetical protein [Myxococcales bacterium]
MTRSSPVTGVLALLLLSCGEQSLEPVQGGPGGAGGGGASSGGGGAGGSVGGSGGTGTGGAAGNWIDLTIAVHGQVTEGPLGVVTGEYPVVADAHVCVAEFIPIGHAPQPPCATTDAAGNYTLDGVPASSPVRIIVGKYGYTSLLGLLATKNKPMEFRVPLLQRVETTAAYFQQAKFAGPPSEKAIVTVCGDLFAGDETMSLTPNAGVTGPVYFDPKTNLPDPSLSATSPLQACAIFEAAPGDYQAAVAHPKLTKCGPWPIFAPGQDAAHANVRAAAGGHSMVQFTCQ